MQTKEKQVTLALVPFIDDRYTIGYRLQSFHKKDVFIEYIDRLQGMIYGNEAFVILADGKHMTTTVDAVKEMKWILKSDL